MRDLNAAYTSSPAVWALDHDPAGFEWIDANDAGRNVYSFIRRGDDSAGAASPDVVCVASFAAIPHEGFRLGLPSPGVWEEILNTDAETYTGSGVGNLGSVTAVTAGHPVNGQPAYADIVLPPLATVWFRKRV